MHTRSHRPRKRKASTALHVAGERPRLEGVASVVPACSCARGKSQLWAWRFRQHRACIALAWHPLVSAACEGYLRTMIRSPHRSRRLLWSLVWPDTMLRQANLALTGLAMGWGGSGCVGPRSRDLLGPVGIVDIHTYLHTPCTEGCNDGMKALIWVLRAHWVMSRY